MVDLVAPITGRLKRGTQIRVWDQSVIIDAPVGNDVLIASTERHARPVNLRGRVSIGGIVRNNLQVFCDGHVALNIIGTRGKVDAGGNVTIAKAGKGLRVTCDGNVRVTNLGLEGDLKAIGDIAVDNAHDGLTAVSRKGNLKVTKCAGALLETIHDIEIETGGDLIFIRVPDEYAALPDEERTQKYPKSVTIGKCGSECELEAETLTVKRAIGSQCRVEANTFILEPNAVIGAGTIIDADVITVGAGCHLEGVHLNGHVIREEAVGLKETEVSALRGAVQKALNDPGQAKALRYLHDHVIDTNGHEIDMELPDDATLRQQVEALAKQFNIVYDRTISRSHVNLHIAEEKSVNLLFAFQGSSLQR